MPIKKEITRSKLKEVKKFLPEINLLTDCVGKTMTVKAFLHPQEIPYNAESDEFSV